MKLRQGCRVAAIPVAVAVNELVGRVLDGLDAGVRARCNRAGIMFALDDLGCASTLADLRQMLAFDAASVKAAIGDAAPGFFFLRLKQATAASAEDAGGSAAASAASSEQPVYADAAASSQCMQRRRWRLKHKPQQWQWTCLSS